MILGSFNERGSDRTLLLTAELYDFLKNPTKKWSFEKANMSYFNGGFVVVIAQWIVIQLFGINTFDGICSDAKFVFFRTRKKQTRCNFSYVSFSEQSFAPTKKKGAYLPTKNV